VTIPIKTLRKVIFLVSDKCEMWLYTELKWYSSNPESEFSLKEASAVGFKPLPKTVLSNKEKVLKITLVSENFKNPRIEKIISIEGLYMRKSNPKYREIGSIFAQKHNSLNRLINKLKIKDPFIIAIGDSENDIDILKRADHSCTVGNATPNVKLQSGYVSNSYYGEGALDCIKKFKSKYYKSN
jgi:hydroxymethylpyrimidine pyrophosphatase-like HAD family hydrolase